MSNPETGSTHSSSRTVAQVLLGLGIACCIIAWLAMPLVDVESVLVSGPILLLIGLITTVHGARQRYRWVAAVGVGHMGICILFVSLVNLLGWGPGAARVPFAIMGAIYIVIILPVSWLAARAIPERQSFGICARCGYLLYGLTEPRCPECGEGFDPAWLPKLACLSGTAPIDGFVDGAGI